MPPHPSPDLSVRERERERSIKRDLKRDLRLDVRIILHVDTERELALPAGTKRRDRYRAIDHQRSHQETSSRYTRDVCPRYRSRSNARIYARTRTYWRGEVRFTRAKVTSIRERVVWCGFVGWNRIFSCRLVVVFTNVVSFNEARFKYEEKEGNLWTDRES